MNISSGTPNSKVAQPVTVEKRKVEALAPDKSAENRARESAPHDSKQSNVRGQDTGDTSKSEEKSGNSGQSNQSVELSEEQRRELEALQRRDREVRAHEQAHLAAAGDLAQGGARYETVTGPDGQRYAVAGEVKIDTAEVPNDPQATIIKAQRIRAAALAPSTPSGTDQNVASQAQSLESKARAELAQVQQKAQQSEQVDQHNSSNDVTGARHEEAVTQTETKPETPQQNSERKQVAVQSHNQIQAYENIAESRRSGISGSFVSVRV